MKVGFIGAGNMASAMIGGIINSKLLSPSNIIASAKTDKTLDNIKEKYKINTTKDSISLVKECDIVVIAVKPNVYEEVLKQIKDYIDNEKIIVTIAAGISINSVEKIIGNDKKIIRTMPNTPALVNCGMSSLSPNKNIEKNDIDAVKTIFDSFGKSEIVDESLIDVVIGASGSSPAYAFMFIEAMADCAVSYGMKREMAYEFCAQAVMGAAKMVLETKKHPGELKDMVCSPGGTTIEAVKTLENEGMRSAVINGMASCIEKSIEMSNMKDTKKYYDYIDKLINDTPDFMLINDDESYVLLDRLVVDLSENAMTWLFKVYLDQNYNILKEDNLTDYIKDKYKDIDLKVRNENGNVFLNKDVIYVILKELEENNQVVYENEKFNLK